MNNSKNFSDSQFSVKMQKLILKLPKRLENCKLRTANSNPVTNAALNTVLQDNTLF